MCGAGQSANEALVWDMRSATAPVTVLTGHRSAVSTLVYRPAERMVITGRCCGQHVCVCVSVCYIVW